MVVARVERKLWAILAADVAGYSRLMGADDEGTIASLSGHRRELFDPCIARHRGSIVKTTGDDLLAEIIESGDAMAVMDTDGAVVGEIHPSAVIDLLSGREPSRP